MLFHTNIFGIVGCENNEEISENSLIIWDDSIGEPKNKLETGQKILNLKLKMDKIIVICFSKILIYNLKNFQYIRKIVTNENPKGLIGINFDNEKTIIVYLTEKEDNSLTIEDLNSPNSTKTLKPHNHKISNITLSHKGLLLATVSEEGRTIRIYDTHDGKLLQELHRGKNIADIKCISIDLKTHFIAASSDRCTIHIWSLRTAIQAIKKENKIAITEEECKIENEGAGFFGKFLSGGGERSFIKIEIKEPYSTFHFGSENSIIIITATGKYCKCVMDLEKKSWQITEEKQLT